MTVIDDLEALCNSELEHAPHRHLADIGSGFQATRHCPGIRGPHNPVTHPAHYTRGSIEVIDFIEDQKLNYHLGNVVKYVVRAGHKDPSKEIEDLKKGAYYLNRRIEQLEQ